MRGCDCWVRVMFPKQLDDYGELAPTVTFINDFAPPDLAGKSADLFLTECGASFN